MGVELKTSASKKPVIEKAKETMNKPQPVDPELSRQRPPGKVWYDTLFISDYDVYLFREGNHYSLLRKNWISRDH